MLGLGEMIDRFQVWRALRAMRAEERRDAKDHYWDFKNRVAEARDNYDLGNRARALEVWNAARTRFPELAARSEPALNLLLVMRRYDEAEALMNAGLRRHANDEICLEGLAAIAMERGDQEECLRRCDRLRSRHPSSWKGYSIAAIALSKLDRPDEAEDMLSRAIRMLPNDIRLQIEHARIAQRRRDWNTALERWMHIHDTFNHSAGTVGAASCLKELGRYDEADQILADSLYRSGSDLNVWIERAAISEHRKDWDKAAEQWDAARTRFPLNAIVYTNGLQPLMVLGNIERAEEVLREGMDQISDDPNLLIAYADLAHKRQDWATEAERWAAVRTRFPDRREGYQRGAMALDAAGLGEEAARVRAAADKR